MIICTMRKYAITEDKEREDKYMRIVGEGSLQSEQRSQICEDIWNFTGEFVFI